MNEQMLMQALSEVGDDLIEMAEKKEFMNPWRKWAQTAAVLAVVACLGVFALPYFPMGCGSSMETTAQVTTEEAPMEMYDEAVEECEETVEECAQEEQTVQESTSVEDHKLQAVGAGEPVQARTKIVCRGTYFYLDPMPTDAGEPYLGEELGTVTDAEEEELVGSSVYAVPYSAWFTNYAVDGQSVTQNICVQTPSGYRYGTTANEKTVSRYGLEDVRTALEQNDLQWLADTFVLPVERFGSVEFAQPSELSSEELHVMLWASTAMNTGVSVSDYWLDDAGHYIIPISDVLWRLDRFLDGYRYAPADTEHYDVWRHALVYDVDEIAYGAQQVVAHEAELMDENTLWILISLPEQEGVTKEYVIRFDDDSWRYLCIDEIDHE